MATNDSRIRLINLENCSQEVKFKGHVNDNLQMMPSFEKHYELIASGTQINITIERDRDLTKVVL